MVDKAWTGNVGEWGEIYAACALLGAGRLSIAERPNPYQLLDLKRPEKQGNTSYAVIGDDVVPSSKGTKVPRTQYADAAKQIRAAIQNRTTGNRAFTISSQLQTQLEHLGFTKISAGSTLNADLHLEILSPNELERISLKGYSIKTEAGAAPSLYNMSTGRHLHFSITADANALEKLNQAFIRGGRGRKKAMNDFAKSGPKITPGTPDFPQCFTSEKMVSDFRSLDGDAPKLIAHAVIQYYFYQAARCSNAVQAVANLDPLGNLEAAAYQRKFAQIWRELYRGIGGKHYAGIGAAQGGILRVRSDLSLLAVPIENDGGGNLLSNTYFDAPDFGRWLTDKGLNALTLTGPSSATLILPWQVRWAANPPRNEGLS
jgi:hypothetical protein